MAAFLLVKWAGLAGGIGCGKSTVAARLAARGGVSIDVDRLSRELQRPGQAVFAAMIDRWGARILSDDGTLDRQAVADITFNDREAMGALMAMTSEAIEDRIQAIAEQHRASDTVVVLEAALLEPGLYGMNGLLVVDAPEDVVIQRLVRMRGMSESDVRTRMAHQPTREQRLANADFVIDNSGDEPALDASVARAWEWLRRLPDATFSPRRRRP